MNDKDIKERERPDFTPPKLSEIDKDFIKFYKVMNEKVLKNLRTAFIPDIPGLIDCPDPECKGSISKEQEPDYKGRVRCGRCKQKWSLRSVYNANPKLGV